MAERISDCVSLKGWPSMFCLQRVRRVKVTAHGNDIDYGQRWFVIQTLPENVGSSMRREGCGAPCRSTRTCGRQPSTAKRTTVIPMVS